MLTTQMPHWKYVFVVLFLVLVVLLMQAMARRSGSMNGGFGTPSRAEAAAKDPHWLNTSRSFLLGPVD